MPRKSSVTVRPSLKRGTGGGQNLENGDASSTASDAALAVLLERVKLATDPDEIKRLSREIEHTVFHKQFAFAEACYISSLFRVHPKIVEVSHRIAHRPQPDFAGLGECVVECL
jgi:hypothetical protein